MGELAKQFFTALNDLIQLFDKNKTAVLYFSFVILFSVILNGLWEQSQEDKISNEKAKQEERQIFFKIIEGKDRDILFWKNSATECYNLKTTPIDSLISVSKKMIQLNNEKK